MGGASDRWSEWLLRRRFGGDAEAAERGMKMLYGVRDRILDAARIRHGDALLDVGAGDGLIGFGALDRVGEDGHVIFSDISRPLLDHAATLARELGVAERCSFVEASAEELRGIDDASVDVVTTRSVLIYVRDKAAALRACYRVLRDGGRAALWEPINRFEATYGDAPAFGVIDPEAAALAERVHAHFRALQPLDGDPMMDFDERDLLRHAEAAGFTNVEIDVHIEARLATAMKWDVLMNIAGNPNIPTIREAMERVLTAEERQRLEQHLRPLVEAGGRQTRSASCLLVATKGEGGRHA